ncbi:MAG: AmmeMemoRadiSam system protein B [Vicinamibacteria bacterium]
MSPILPSLRGDIDVMPSPIPDRPGLLLRDPIGYTDAVLVVPSPWLAVLSCLDGAHTELDAQALLTRLAGGEIVPLQSVRELLSILNQAGFLETDEFRTLKATKQGGFRRSVVRGPSHVGSAYPDTAPGIDERFEARFPSSNGGSVLPKAIAAPHVSPDGGFASYRAAYEVNADGREPTFVILGTSHYGPPERFGLTRKPFRTPFGAAEVASELHELLLERAGDAIVEEDYCHAPEHSIEFQVLFLQYRLRRKFRILPILCGPFADSLRTGQPPERLDSNRRFFDALSELASTVPDLVWILGVDMAHIGRRYGHSDAVRATEGVMIEVAERDRERLDRICAGDAEGFFALVHPEQDPSTGAGSHRSIRS